MSNSTSNAAMVEKARSFYEGKEAIYIERGALRVRVNNVHIGIVHINTNDLQEYLAFDLEEIPTPNLPVWRGKGPSLGPYSLRWEVGTNFETHLLHDYCSAYVGWSMHFSPRMVAEVVEIATNFAEDEMSDLYGKITGHIDDEIIKAFRNSIPARNQ
jgi:hypothetical protein